MSALRRKRSLQTCPPKGLVVARTALCCCSMCVNVAAMRPVRPAIRRVCKFDAAPEVGYAAQSRRLIGV